MTPDVSTNLQIVNVTNAALFSGNGGSNEGKNNQYQMNSWFPGGTGTIADVQGSASYMLQFLRGVGDEDDGADLQINVGPNNDGPSNVVWLQARSADNSAHYMQALVQTPSVPGSGPFAIAINENGTWPTRQAQEVQLKWYCGRQTVPFGPFTGGAQSLAVIDLQAVFGAEAAQQIGAAIQQGQPSAGDSYSYWLTIQEFLTE
ncbi:hypothetical protein [Methylorubrum sp. SB2]|uniref:hypothetical protein n=1 Tax=Methylorubrum subtropicum TaxID=3138812 RepID=UPI00313B8F17